MSHGVTTTTESTGDIGCSHNSQAVKGNGGNQNVFSPSHLTIVVVAFAVSVLIIATLVFIVATQRRLRNSTKLDLIEVTLGDNHATTYGLHMNSPGGPSPFHTPHGTYGTPPAQPSALRANVPSVSLPTKTPEVMQSMPSDIRNEDERLIMSRTLSLSRKQQSSTQSSSPSKNMNDALLKTLPDERSNDKTAPPTLQISTEVSKKTNPRAGMRMGTVKPGSPRKTYRISILDSDLDDYDDFTIEGTSQHFVDDVLEGIIDSARPSAALSPSSSPRYLDPSVTHLGGTPYLRSATTPHQ